MNNDAYDKAVACIALNGGEQITEIYIILAKNDGANAKSIPGRSVPGCAVIPRSN